MGRTKIENSRPGVAPAVQSLSNQLENRLVEEIHVRSLRILPDIIELRRHLHRHPEPSEREFATTEYLARQVEGLGLQPVVTDQRTGLTCDLVYQADATVQRLVLRGDIDALPISDAKSVDYRSTRDGCMHACGHDAHPAIVFGSLRVLRSLAQDGLLPWSIAVRGLFQPAEEVATGATTMIQAHALRDVSAAFALHVDPTRAVGQIGLRAGTFTASCDTFQIEIVGKGGHGARPHLTNDPIEAAASWINSTFRRLPRRLDAHHPVVISVGMIQGGQAANIIPETVSMQGTLRTLTRVARRDALEAMEDINQAVEREFCVAIKQKLLQSAPPVENDATLTSLLAQVAEQVLCAGCVEWIEQPSMGSEDFSYYLDHVPGVMFRLGVAGPQVGHAPLHTPLFDIDEQALLVGVRLFTAIAIAYFNPSQPMT